MGRGGTKGGFLKDKERRVTRRRNAPCEFEARKSSNGEEVLILCTNRVYCKSTVRNFGVLLKF